MAGRPEGGTKRRTAEVRRSQIAGAALEIIAARGLRHFTGREIGRSLGMTDAAVFRHLPSKRAIVQAAIDRVEQLLFEEFPPVHPDPVERLGLFFGRRSAVVAGNPGVARLLLSDDLAHAGGPAESARVQEFKRRTAGFVTGCLREAHAHGRLAAAIDPGHAALMVMGTLISFVIACSAEDGGGVAREAERLWGGLKRLLFPPCQPASVPARCGRKAGRSRRTGHDVSIGESDE